MGKRAENKIKLAMYLDKDLKAEFKKLTEQNKTCMSDVLLEAIENYERKVVITNIAIKVEYKTIINIDDKTVIKKLNLGGNNIEDTRIKRINRIKSFRFSKENRD